jgi:hypothetical protein
MDYWNAVSGEAQRVYETTMQHSSAEATLLRQALSLYAEAFAIADDPAEPKAATARKALVSHNFNTLNLAFDAALRGYYVQSTALLRNIHENWLAFWYLAKYPQEADYWLNPSWEQRPPKAETMRNKIDHPSKEAKSKLHGFYKELSRLDHTDPAAVLSRIELFENKPVIRVGVRYDQDDFAACAYGICLWAGNTLDTIASIVAPDNKWHEKHAKLGDKLLAYIEKYNESHVGKDIV